MVTLLLTVIIFAFFAAYYHVQAVKYAMNKYTWFLAGLALGPMLFPFFSISKTMSIRKATGFNNLYLNV